MKRNRFSTLFVIMVFALSCLSTIFVGGEVYAKRDAATASAAWSNTYYKKGILHAVKKCYNKGVFSSSIDADNITNNGFDTILTSAGMGENTKVAIPSGYGVLGDNKQEITCAELFFGGIVNGDGGRTYSTKSDFTPLLVTIGVVADSDFDFYDGNSTTSMDTKYSPDTVDKVMNVLGYTKKEKKEAKEVTFQWNKKAYYDEDIIPIYQTIKLNGSKLEYIGNPEDPVYFQISEADNGKQRVTIKVTDKLYDYGDRNALEIDELNVYFPNVSGTAYQYIDSYWNSFKQELYSKITALGNTPSKGGYFDDSLNLTRYDFVYNQKNVSANYYYSLEDYKNNSQAFLNRVLKRISGDDNFDNTLSLRYSIKEKVAYYLNSIYSFFHAGYNPVDAPAIIECGFDDGYGVGDNRIPINVDANGEKKSGCGVLSTNLKDNGNSSIYGFDSSSFFDAGMAKGKLDFYAVVAEINKLSENFDEGSDLTPTDPGTTTQETEADCYSADGLNGMAWVLCPTLYNLEGAAVGISGLIDNMLEVDADYYRSGSETETIWGYMRTIANTFLAIILVAVILSQLTGYGIDNYGIKKLLPKFVIMVILINVSFLLCQLAIDASNILGQGLNNMFQTMASHDVTFGEVVSMVTGGFIALITGAGAYSGLIASGIMAFTSGGNAAVIAVLILSILAILIGVLMFFLMLGARMIIIILFTAISPIAFACYILPNTQKWFKNWWNVFRTALVMYPICGAVYGLSAVIRSIVFPGGASSVDIHPVIAIVAVLTPVLPYYIMPSLVKSTLSGLGAVGQFFNSIGNGIRKGISEGSRTLQNTGAYKSGTETAQRNMARWNAGLDKNGNEKKLSRVGRFVRGGNKGMAAARQQYVADQNKIAREGSMMGEGFQAALINQTKAAEAEDVKNYETLINKNTNNGANEGALFSMYDEYVKQGNKAGAIAVAKIAGRRKDTAAKFMKEKITGRGLSGDALSEFNNKYTSDSAREIFKSVNKEIAEGDNSKNYRASAPTDFEFSSSLNKVAEKDKALPDNLSSFSAWAGISVDNPGASWGEASGMAGLAGAANIASAIDHGITNSSELVGASASTLKDLKTWVDNTSWVNNVSDDTYKAFSDQQKTMFDSVKNQRNKLIQLAATTYDNRDKPGAAWDTTVGKVDAISSIAALKPNPATTTAAATNGAAQPGAVFDVQGAGSALASDQYAAPQPRPTETSGQQMFRNGQQWANEVAQNGGTVTKSGIWVPESNNRKPSNPKPNNGGGVM